MLRAWKGLPRFEGRSSLRSWLYTISTNTCLNAIERRPKRVLPIDYGPAADPHVRAPKPSEDGAPVVENVWLEPLADERLEIEDGLAGPDATYEQRESVELAFVAALQHLPANQRAALILRAVLGFSAKETADILDTSVASVNSALQRARKTVDEKLPSREPAGRAAQPGRRRAARPGRALHHRAPGRRRRRRPRAPDRGRHLVDAPARQLVPRQGGDPGVLRARPGRREVAPRADARQRAGRRRLLHVGLRRGERSATSASTSSTCGPTARSRRSPRSSTRRASAASACPPSCRRSAAPAQAAAARSDASACVAILVDRQAVPRSGQLEEPVDARVDAGDRDLDAGPRRRARSSAGAPAARPGP